jgi:Domain of unknown function (DUF1835)
MIQPNRRASRVCQSPTVRRACKSVRKGCGVGDQSTQSHGPGAPEATNPFRLNLDQQHKRVEALRRALLAGDATALLRYRRHHPKVHDTRNAETIDRSEALTGAELIIARELGLPSWPELKAHVAAMERERDSIAGGAPAPDRDASTLHVRCGSDLETTLREGGFSGDFLECSDPLCQGPVVEADDWLERRAEFLTQAYGAVTRQGAEQIMAKLERAEVGLRTAADRYQRVALWFEHDSFDQFILARCLARFATAPPGSLELISVNRYPGPVRFIGLGQLPPEALRLLWNRRQKVSGQQLSAGRAVWQRLRDSDPSALASAARAGIPELPYMAQAVRRHCQELPWVGDGLGLTERLILKQLAERPSTVGEVFRDLMLEHEPLPWLGDVMFLFIVESMKRVSRPVFTSAFDDATQRWPQERLTITPLGREVLAGQVDWLSLCPPQRWQGGVGIVAGVPCWRWDARAEATVLQ